MDIDYLVIGAGATAMAFVDVIVAQTDKRIAIVDRRDAPGGHWNDAYPFVRLHQSSSFYGVPSRALGQGRKITRGLNAGMTEMASKPEILHYYSDLMENVYLPSGRVAYYPQSEHLGDGRIRSLLTGAQTQLNVTGKIVEAGRLGDLATFPSTHTPNFTVAPDVAFGPVNDLPRRAAGHDSFTVIGAGKTGMDAVLWLLDRGVDPDVISWVRPNDYWVFKRDSIMPDPDYFDSTIENQLQELQSLSQSSSVREHCENLEKTGRWQRIDPDVWPKKFHAAVCSKAEIEALRRVKTVYRMGHVTAIEADRLVMAEGEVPVTGNRLFVDCTAQGGVIVGKDAPPVFDGDRINMFMVRPFQPVFSAALIAHLETTLDDDAAKNDLAQITDFHDTPYEFVAVQMAGFVNQYKWNQTPAVRDWIERCRLNAGTHLLARITPDQTDKMAMLGQLGPLTGAAMKNIPKMLAAGDDAA